MEDHWVFGVWNLISFRYHAQRVLSIFGRHRVILVPRTGLAWRHLDVHCNPRPNKSVVERRALQSITCDVRTSRRPVLHNNIFHYSTPL